jgi:hypothetical protein
MMAQVNHHENVVNLVGVVTMRVGVNFAIDFASHFACSVWFGLVWFELGTSLGLISGLSLGLGLGLSLCSGLSLGVCFFLFFVFFCFIPVYFFSFSLFVFGVFGCVKTDSVECLEAMPNWVENFAVAILVGDLAL